MKKVLAIILMVFLVACSSAQDRSTVLKPIDDEVDASVEPSRPTTSTTSTKSSATTTTEDDELVDTFVPKNPLAQPDKDEAGHPIYTNKISFETLDRGYFSNKFSRSQHVIRDEDAFNLVWKTAFGENAPALDLTKLTVIAVFQGEQKTGGYDTRIDAIVDAGDKIVVYVDETVPEADSFVTQAITSPFHVVTIAKTNKEVRFVFLE